MIAQAFSADLNNLFEINKPGIDVTIGQNIDWESHESTELGYLSQAVEQRYEKFGVVDSERGRLSANGHTEDRLCHYRARNSRLSKLAFGPPKND